MLQIKHKNSEKRPLWLVDAKYTLGRDAGCDIQVEDPSVAGCQAELHVSLEEVTLHNLGEPELVSVNGDFVNTPLKLAHGDEVIIGSQVFELLDPKRVRALSDSNQQAAVVPQGVSGWSLKATNTALANRNFPIDHEVVIGRSSECDITLGVAHLSRRHARLYFSGEQLEVEDLRSSNGTYVNGKKVERSLLRTGDELSLDTLSFVVIGPEDDSDSTMMRPPPDIEKTNLRPAIKIDEIKPGPRVARPAKPASKPNPAGRRTQQVVQEPPEDSSNNALIVGAVIAALIAAGAAYWFFMV